MGTHRVSVAQTAERAVEAREAVVRFHSETLMPIRHTERGWWWGSRGPFKTRAKALAVAAAAHASGFRERHRKK